VLVYWITTNTWTIGQQYVVKRRLGPVKVPTVEVATSSNGGGGSGTGGGGSRGAGAKAGASVSDAPANGAAAIGGIGALLRSKVKPDKEAVAVATPKASGPPPRPPRKKKKRSGRRR
jgi:YidC/Oxa1 family membrane protein insertase